jgi:putative ABC transport system substrate-binding protein
MRRRAFIAALGGAAAWPLIARGQHAAMPVIGYVSTRSHDAEAPMRGPFVKTLEEGGFFVGKNIAIEYRYSQRGYQMLELVSELVRHQAAILIATDHSSALAAKATTSTVPIVFASGDDPVKLGLVASLSNPGGNATGFYVFTSRLGSKRLGLLRELLPNPGLIAFMVDPNGPSTPLQIEEMQVAARAIAQPLLVLRAGTEREVDAAFATMAQQQVSAVMYGATTFYQVINERLVALAAQHKIPAFYEWREAVLAGGLMSYNANRNELGRQIGNYAAQILKGAQPADLPAVQSSSFVFVINLKTAKALGLDIPPSLLARADEVIE